MKIYFAGSIRAGRDDQVIYEELIRGLQELGTVLTEHVGSPELTDAGDDGPSDDEIYRRDMGWLEDADVVVAEATVPSLGVGYEIGRAEMRGKPIICLYRPGPDRRLSAMISGNRGLTVHCYEQVEEALIAAADFVGKHREAGRNRG